MPPDRLPGHPFDARFEDVRIAPTRPQGSFRAQEAGAVLRTREARGGLGRAAHAHIVPGGGLGHPDLYFRRFVGVDDVAGVVGATRGVWLNERDDLIRGKWKLLAWWMAPLPVAVR